MATRKQQRRAGKAVADAAFLTLRVRGPGMRSGRIAVPDLIKICQEAQNAVRRQAEALAGRKTIHPGPTAQAIQAKCTLELVAIKKGSTKLEFGLATPQLPLPFPNFGTFGTEVIAELASSIKSLGNGNGKEIDGGVLQSLYGLGSLTDDHQIAEIEWISPRMGTRPRIAASINKTVRERITSRLNLSRRAQMTIDGVLDMVDFKPKDRKCRIDPAVGASIMCTFGIEQESQVCALLRKPVRASGEGVLQPYSDRTESLRIDKITELPSSALGKGNFFGESSIADLALSQRVSPLLDARKLSGGFPEDEDIDDFLKEIYEARR